MLSQMETINTYMDTKDIYGYFKEDFNLTKIGIFATSLCTKIILRN